MMTLYVPAHTSERGNQTKVKNTLEVWRHPTSSATVLSNSGSVVTDRCYREEATVKGPYSSQFPGFRMPTSYTRAIVRSEDLSGGYLVTVNGYNVSSDDSRTDRGVIPNTSDFAFGGAAAWDLNQRSRAIAEALKKVLDQKIHLGTALAESRKTLDMIATRIRTLLALYKALRAGKFHYAYHVLFGRSLGVRTGKTASELWLEWQYGWRPLISDIWGGVELVREGFRKKNLLFSVERTITDPGNPASLFIPSYDITTSGMVEISTKVKFWGCVRDTVSSAASALGLINPASIAWELTPYSFVIDWLVPIGTWLESLTATVGVDFVAGFATYRLTADVEGVRERYSGRPSDRYIRPPRIRVRKMVMERVPYSSWPWAIPYWKSPFSTTHVTSAIALLSNSRR